jgi:predicted Zn-dependent protease
VLKIFSGSDLEAYLDNASGMPLRLDLEFNQFAHERFPHNLAFVRHLMSLYQTKEFRNDPLWESLLRQHWFEDDMLRNQFFEFLSRRGKLEAELQALNATNGDKTDWAARATANPVSTRFVAEAQLWRSHFEDGAPVIAAVAQEYPADVDLGQRASSVYRSLAYFEPRDTEVAVQIESNLLKSMPADRDTMARIGDIYSDRELFTQAAPYWNRMAETEPGKPASYEEAATVYWDYYFFDDALRLLNLGRTKLADDSLYSYQVGAIYENKRDYARAVDEYVKGALADGGNSESRSRLLQLATRKSGHDLVDAATDKAVTASKYDLSAIDLRIAVLEAQQRKADIATLLNTALDRSTSVEVLESIENTAKEKSLEAVRQHALERQAAVSTDPIRRLELRYALVNFYEQKKDMVSAQHNVEALYQDNPKIMGVVRSTVDFYWRNKQQQKAIDVLVQAANSSYPALKTKFTYEAARKMTETAQYQPARKLLVGLVESDPYNSEYLAAVADTYARSGDQAGLRDFYLEKIKFFQKSTLSQDDRKSRIAALRRGLIPALTSLKDYAGGIDQYIEIINAYPEDAGVTSEAAYYAQRYQRKDQLLNFYVKTVAASPKDSRWAVVLARVQTTNEDFDAAISTYAQAIKIRPDRVDLQTARAALEERLLRFDDAATDYASLYELAYHDTKWMEKVAEIRARQSKPDLTLQALKVAFIDGRPEGPAKYFTVAERLEGWNMLGPAREYAEKGVAAAGNDLLAGSENHSGAQVYTRIMTRLRQQEAAYQKLNSAITAAQQLPPIAQQVAKGGLDATTSAELRANLLRTRNNNARSGMAACMREMGTAVSKYFTPEEKQAMAQSLNVKNDTLQRDQVYDYLMPLAEKAGFADFQVKVMFEQGIAGGQHTQWLQNLEPLQLRRLKLMELGQQWERIAGATGPAGAKSSNLQRSGQVFQMAGSPDDELRVLRKIDAISYLNQDRYFELLLSKEPQQLERYAAVQYRRDAVTNFLLAHSDADRTINAVHAARLERPAVWDSAYTSLVGLYFNDPSPRIQSAFQTALADGTIGERLGKPLDRNQSLAGDVWFTYGSRYGEYLGATKKGDPEDFLAAEMEHTPGRAGAYFNTAVYYEDSVDLPRAIADYQHVMELAPQRIDVHNRLAGIYWKQKKNDQAIAEWKRVLEMLKAQASSRGVPETFWGDFSATVTSLATRRMLPQFQPDINQVLHSYVKNNGTYRVLPLLRSTLPRLENSAAATAFVIDLSNDAQEKFEFLRQFITGNTDLKPDVEPIYARVLVLAQEHMEKSEGGMKAYAQSELDQLRVQWLQLLFKTKQFDRAREELNSLPKSVWETQPADLVPLQLKLAAQNNSLDPILDRYRADLEHAPASEILRKAATELQQSGDKPSARKLLELVFAREIENHNLTAANMLGLADIRIQSGDLESGVALLKRMALVVGNPFETQDPAAALLVRTGHPAEAIGFLEDLVKAVPWNADYQVRLAQARIAAAQNADGARKSLAAIAASTGIAYDTRLNAARSLSGTNAGDLGSKELNLMAGGGFINPGEANQHYFFAARLKAAENLPSSVSIVLLRAALEDYPNGDVARVPLLKAAGANGNYELAIAVMKPYLQGNLLDAAYRGSRNSDEDDELLDQDSSRDGTPREFGKLPAKDWAEINRDLGQAFEKTGSPEQAVTYLRRAYALEPDAAVKSQINKQVQQIRALLRRQTTNAARRPIIRTELEQEHVVRPRVPEPAASSPPPVTAPAKKGAGL